jgi:hypothetical protein
MTKQAAVKATLIAMGKPDMTFDYALPQEWLDRQAVALQQIIRCQGKHVDSNDCYDRILGQTVWAYDSLFGGPLAITEDGRKVAQLLGW